MKKDINSNGYIFLYATILVGAACTLRAIPRKK